MNTLAFDTTILAMRAARYACGIFVGHVREVMRPLPIEPISGAADGVLGLSLIRGNPIPVIALSGLLKGDAGVSVKASRFVTIRTGERTAALLVDEVSSVRKLDTSRFESLPLLWQAEQSAAVATIGTLDQELFLVLDSMRMLPEHFPEPTASGGGHDG